MRCIFSEAQYRSGYVKKDKAIATFYQKAETFHKYYDLIFILLLFMVIQYDHWLWGRFILQSMHHSECSNDS